MVFRKKITGIYIDSLDRYDETNYLDVLFTADGYGAVSFFMRDQRIFPDQLPSVRRDAFFSDGSQRFCR